MSKNAFLEVPDDNDAPFENLFLQANEQFKDLVQSLSGESKGVKTKPIKPSPGFCIKLRDANGSKLFVNICHTPELPEPRDISEEELIHILGSEDPTSYRVPLSLGLPHEESDKGGNKCKAYDVIINDTFFRKVQSNELFKTFVITVAIDGIEDKYDAKPDREGYVVLKNKTYMGTMPNHCIQDRKGPLIAELETVSQTPAKRDELVPKETSSAVSRSQSSPSSSFSSSSENMGKLHLTKHSFPGQRDTLVARFNLPGVKSGESLTLDLGEDQVVLESKEPPYLFNFFVPYVVDQETSVAEFNTRFQVLTVTMPLLPSEC